MRARGCLRGVLALGACALALGVGAASARAAEPVRRAREDPSRPGRPAHRVGWYARGGLGIGYDTASVWHDVETASESARGRARIESRYRGAGARVEAMGAVRVARGLVGLGFVLGDTRTQPAQSPGPRSLALVPDRGREWWLVGPMGGAQLGRGPTWVIAGMMGWGKTRTGGFEAPEGIAVKSSRVHESVVGVSVSGGPCWPLGSGWMLGAHLRFTAVRTDLTPFTDRDIGSEVALLADISFQSP